MMPTLINLMAVVKRLAGSGSCLCRWLVSRRGPRKPEWNINKRDHSTNLKARTEAISWIRDRPRVLLMMTACKEGK